MLTVIYGISLLVGGGLLAASILLGGHDSDVDHDMDHDVDHDFDHDVDHDFDHDVDHDFDHDVDHDLDHDADVDGASADHVGEMASSWIPFLSMRFWTFFFAFFGMTGLLLTLPQLVSNWLVALLISLAMGLVWGFVASYIIHRLKTQVVGSVTSVADFEGSSGKVVLPISQQTQGKVRVWVQDQFQDLMAYTEEEGTLAAGEEVLIVRFTSERGAKVTRMKS